MNYYQDVKFILNVDVNENSIENAFNKAKNILNWRIDENSNAILIDEEVDYQIKDVSNLKETSVEEIIDSFFDFTFDDIIDVPLYRFLVLKNNENFTILANINSLIFDYSSINDFYELFDNSEKSPPKFNLDSYYKDVQVYLKSSDFENESRYWKNYVLNSSKHIKFYNIKHDHYKSQKINPDMNSVSRFIKNHDCTLFDFYGSIFSLYLSRIDRLDGCLLKTIVPRKTDLQIFDKNTLFKVDVNDHDSFDDLLDEFESALKNAVDNTKVDVDNYLGENVSYYTIYDFYDLNENISVYNGEDSALTLNIYENSLELLYNSDLFSDEYIGRMAKNIESLIDNVLNSPNAATSDIDILSEDEKKLLLDFYKGIEDDIDKEFILSKYFRHIAISNPDIIAVDDGVDRISYGELEKSSNSIANDLFENYNISLGSHVALLLPRNYHFLELVLALNKIGATFVPIDLTYPIKRIEHMLEISESVCIVTTEDIANKSDFNLNVVCIEDLNYDDDADVDIISRSEDLFSIMFTSGTTGLPKGVMVSNYQMGSLSIAFKHLFSFSCGETAGCYVSFSFIASYMAYVVLALGGCVRIFNENEQKNSLLIIEALKETPMNNLILPPTIGVPIYDNEDLKLDYLILAGAKLNELSKRDRHTKLVNFYGTTELILTISKIYNLNDVKDNRVPVGKPVANTWVYVLDENSNIMPIGVPGELCVSGEIVSSGYYNNPELTNQFFVDNPIADSESNGIMYRTGDIGFYNPEGEIEIIGREDDQLSVRGFRVESNEILIIMKKFKEISDVYLDVDNDNLIAYYTTNAELDINEVKENLEDNLPSYMIPSLFIELDEIPLNLNGKIDKSSLKTALDNDNIEITDEVISHVVNAFKEVLNIDSVFIDDDFVGRGGNSLSAMKLQLLLKEKLGVNLSSNEIISLSTPKDISNHIKYNMNIHSALYEDKYLFDEPCPLSESQLNVYLDESVNDMGTAYNNPFKIKLKDNYSVSELKNALIKLFEVFPILKARVFSDDGILSFAFDAEPEINEGHLNDINSFVKSFEFDKYLSRFLIVENKQSVILCADFHHLIFDGTSLNILLDVLFSILNGEDVDFVDYGVLKQVLFEENIDSNYMDNAHEFFDEMLADNDEVYDLLPSLKSSEDEFELVDTIELDAEYLNSFLQKHSITHNQFFASVFAYALSRFSGSNKVLFNIIDDGRGNIDLSESVGMFVKTLPVLLDCTNQNVDSFLDYSSTLINSVMKYDLYPFRLLASEYDLNSNILFQYSHDLFNDMLNKEDSKYGIEELEHDLNADLSLSIFNAGEDRLMIRTLYSSLYSKDFIEHFVESYKLILQDIIEVEELKDINYTAGVDFELLDSYNQTGHSLIYEDILDAFNDNLAKYPKNNLVSYNDNVYSYDEGAFIADKIADSLRSFGVGKGENVAFLVERSELYIFSILGILSAGAVYVPLDDSLPDERLSFMLRDTNSKVVIVSDETSERAFNLGGNCITLNISEIVNDEIGILSCLPVVYSDLACILYTSGTTGVPKGVKITRKSVINLSNYFAEDYPFDNLDVCGLYPSIGFDAASQSIFKTIYAGASLVIIPDDIKLDMIRMNDYFLKYNVTYSAIPTQVAKLFMQTVEDTSLKSLSIGGEKLGEFENPLNHMLIDEFGPTEAFAFISSIDNSKKIDSSSVGFLNYNTKTYILDNEFRQVPIGAVGELYLAGYQIADGYLNREEENIKSFIENPFDDSVDYGVLYRTGDMVRLLPDGSLGLVGRRDSQVKISGNRVELSEIESVIREIDYITDVTVQTIKHMDNYELVAYVVASDESDDETLKEHVRDYVAQFKPGYMIPSFVVRLDSIPLNINGKIDYRHLPEVDLDSLRVEYVAPNNEIEKQIANAFEIVFNQKDIGLNDDFVRLGGDSITAIRVVSLLEKNDINCGAGDILNYKTPYLIAQNVGSIEKVAYDAVEGIMDLLPIQEYFFDQINEDEFSQHFILKSSEKIDINTLQESFDELCNVHDMLRTKYSYDENGKVIQEILPVNTQIREIGEHNITENLEESLKAIYIKSFKSLSIKNKLIEINLIHHNNESYLMFIIHHLIIDGVSWNILITDLTHIYTNLKQGKEIELLRPYPYKNWVEDVRYLAENISYEEKQHWTKLNRQIDDSTIKGDNKPFALDFDVNYDADNLLMLSEEEYWALAIARAYKKTYGKELILNRESHGRDESIAKLNRTIGWFTSQYPILINTNNKNDNISIMNDVYNIKTALRDVKNLGLNYSSLIYTTKELEFKHCPVTFNFLSSEFAFENELFESYIPKSASNEEINIKQDPTSYGITFNIARNADSYMVSGDYADNTYIGNDFNVFIKNIESELKFLGNYTFKDNNIVCCLSESQLGIYLDEKVHEKDTAYSAHGIFEYDAKYTTENIKDAIHALINRHPILKGRILDTENLPLLICDSYPTIEIINTTDYSNLIKAFDLDKFLARFYILDNEQKKFVFYDMHHIISDATSCTIINKELRQALLGKLDDNVDLGFAYASRNSFESHYNHKYESSQKFFHDEFADIDEIQHLLSDLDGDKGSVSLPIRGVRDDIETFTENIGISVGSLLNAAFAYTYSRFIGGNKVYYNFTEHGRHEDYSQNAIGMFVRTIPIIANCENKSINDYLTNMSDLILNSMTNSIYPFRLLAKEYNLSIDVAFEYNHDLNDFDIGNDLVASDDADGISDFLCVVNDLEDGFVVTVSHLDKFSQHTAKQFVKAFKEVLVQFLEKEKLEDISYISNEDIELLDSYNKTQCPLKYCDILDAFNDNLARYPKNSLVTYKNNSYTYDESAFIANKIANDLKKMGINKNDNVAFLVERSELYLFTILGILSTGATYVPLDDALPDERIKFMMDDADAEVVIVCDDTYNRAKNLSEENRLLNISNIIKENIGTSSKLDVTYSDLACILYTSGTTGIPKGVRITRKAILNLSQTYCDTYDFGRNDVYALYSNIGFDAGSQAILQTTYAGASLTVIPEDIKFNITKLNEHFIKQNVTHTFISTQVAKLFMEQIDNTSLRILSVGGEKLGKFESPKDYRLIDAYGPTETFAFISSIDNDDKKDGSSAGMLNENTRAYILDDNFRRVPVGAVGELCLAGYQIADGYLNRPEENAKAFINNPFDDKEGYSILYRTGDMVRLLPDGSLGIVGRRDSQVKIRGNRVELTEVESAIRDMDYIKDVTVQITSNNGNNELIAYIVLSDGFYGDDIDNSVREFVSKCKPNYMVPSYVITLYEIPLNVNGKVDKRALPDVDIDSLRDKYVAPRNKNEKEIVEAFKKALNLEKVSIYDDFIRLGGDSLTATKLSSYVKSDDVTMADIFTFRTPEAIAKNISEYSFDLDIYSLEDGCPLNSAQSDVIADIIGYNKSDAYHVISYIPISKKYDLEKILSSLDEMLNMHPVLSMRLSERHDESDTDVSNRDALNDLMRTAKKFGTKKFLNIINGYGIKDICGLYNMLRTLIRLFKGEYPYLVKGNKPPISVESKFDRDVLIDFLSESFDIYDCLSKFMIIESEDSYYLFCVVHHLIFDAVSAGVFKSDFMTLLDGGSIDFDDGFLKASAFTHQMKRTGKFNEAREFYHNILSNLDDVDFLLEDNPSAEGYNMSTYDLDFDKKAFKSFLNNAGISEYVLFIAVFSYALSQFVNGDKAQFIMNENGRDRFNEKFISMTSNLVPVVIDCKDQSINSFIRDAADTVYKSLRYSYYPTFLLYPKYDFERDIAFQFVPNWIADDFDSFENIDDMGAGEIINQVLNDFNDFVTELFVQVHQNGDDYRLIISHSNKYSQKMINDFKDTYTSILSNIINASMSSDLSSTLK
ncbi:non-ribosomal peptide synthetase [Methanobrevibacter sp.]|uniref:non-ribosomal peptide synthetase n=1 Tax=Methanobrevibacter sp. TaxID=66852 RepID=UPI0025FF9E88|nr:non-ribosomal peptide synthetase [Methanobrevibacter sp.]MBQ2831509.1 amino acid adenylation domain-containing protein [Methanobrevibacter sp.]